MNDVQDKTFLKVQIMIHSDILPTEDLDGICDALKVFVNVKSTDFKTGTVSTRTIKVFNPLYHNCKYRCVKTGKLYRIVAGKEKPELIG
jgi:hypothetical protein